MFLDDMAKEAKNILTTVCDEQCTMSDRLLPKHCALLIAQAVNRKKKDKSSSSKGKNAGASMLLGGAGDDNDRPGSESYRKTREELTTLVTTLNRLYYSKIFNKNILNKYNYLVLFIFKVWELHYIMFHLFTTYSILH